MFVLGTPGGVEDCGAWMSWLKIVEEMAMYPWGSARGDGAELEEGHSRTYPAGN